MAEIRADGAKGVDASRLVTLRVVRFEMDLCQRRDVPEWVRPANAAVRGSIGDMVECGGAS